MKGAQATADEHTHAEERAHSEAKAYDEGRVWEVSSRWHNRVPHVILAPNTIKAEERFHALMAERAHGASVLDVGCGSGFLTAELHAMGASRVYGFDVSEGEVEKARAHHGQLQGVTFGVHGVEAPIDGVFDLIVGRSILHHVDFHQVLPTLFERNLAPRGRMLFMEPMSHPMTLAFHRLVRSAHTPDEWPLKPSDIAWLRTRFDAKVIPVNLLSFPLGVFSSFFLRPLGPDNPLMRMVDRIDRSLERSTVFQALGRQGIIVIDRPGTKSIG